MPILNWIGKDAVVNHDKDVPFRLLKKNKSKSVGDSENLIIEGDNLEALKALLPHYQNKIKCIYIDPPYNTGNEKWVYNDNVNSPKIKKWLGKVVGGEDEDLTRHDKWLCMMYPRLKLLRELLRDDGVIFISIDENEIQHLKLIMNEIFDESNLLSIIANVSNPKGRSDDKYIASAHEYLLVYQKNNAKLNGFKPEDKVLKRFNKTGVNNQKYREINLRKTGDEDKKEDRENMYYYFYYNEKTKEFFPSKNKKKLKEFLEIEPLRNDNTKGRWRWSLETSQKNIKEIFPKYMKNENKWSVFEMDYLEKDERVKATSAWTFKDVNSERGTEAFVEMGFEKESFPKPKPIGLLNRIITLALEQNSEDIILDSFAGSGTTAQAVLELNKEDEGNRKFILIELESEICKKITSERVKKVIKGYDDVSGTGGGFQYAVLDKKLFNADGRINPECTFEELASYLYFTETKTILDTKKINKTLLDTHNETQIHLMFDGIGKNNLDRKFLSTLDKNKDKIIYADKCTLDDSTLEKHKTIFKQIPYEVKEF